MFKILFFDKDGFFEETRKQQGENVEQGTQRSLFTHFYSVSSLKIMKVQILAEFKSRRIILHSISLITICTLDKGNQNSKIFALDLVQGKCI